MRIAVVGKGGSGKTTTSGVVARSLARSGCSVVALDCDSNPNLGISLGVGDAETERLVAMRQALDEGAGDHAADPVELLDRFGVAGPDGVRLAVVNRIAEPEPGCPCCGVSPEQLLATVDVVGRVVVADLEAGIGTLTRMGDQAVEVVIVVVEPTPKSIEVGTRVVELVGEQSLGRVAVVANRIRGTDDEAVVRAAFPGQEVVVVPDDANVVEADRRGVAPLDLDPSSPAVLALAGLAERLRLLQLAG